MRASEDARYALAPGTQVREEDFGLLFYAMQGPRLYFLSSGDLLDRSFFQGKVTVEQWIRLERAERSVTRKRIEGIQRSLGQLRDKGVVVEC